MNLTISIDDAVVARAREIARVRGVSLDQLVQHYLELLISAPDPWGVIADLEAIWEGEVDERETARWKREDLYDRRFLR